jgi:hypothetical protein
MAIEFNGEIDPGDWALHGWEGRISLKIEDLNRYWKIYRRNNSASYEQVTLETVTTPGRVWNFFSGHISQPASEYFKKDANTIDMRVTRRISDESNMRLIKEPGRQGRYINEMIVLTSGDRLLCQDIPLQGAKISLDGKYLRLYNIEPLSYIVREGQSERDIPGAVRFREFLEIGKAMEDCAS